MLSIYFHHEHIEIMEIISQSPPIAQQHYPRAHNNEFQCVLSLIHAHFASESICLIYFANSIIRTAHNGISHELTYFVMLISSSVNFASIITQQSFSNRYIDISIWFFSFVVCCFPPCILSFVHQPFECSFIHSQYHSVFHPPQSFVRPSRRIKLQPSSALGFLLAPSALPSTSIYIGSSHSIKSKFTT